jgi:hypothetical protein
MECASNSRATVLEHPRSEHQERVWTLVEVTCRLRRNARTIDPHGSRDGPGSSLHDAGAGDPFG